MKTSDFENMDWRLDLCKAEVFVLHEYDDLNSRFIKFALDSVKVFETITNDQLVRFIVYAYHKNSPFVRKITEPKHRKNQALLQAGVDLKLEEVKEIIACEHEKTAELIYAFLAGENNMDFATLMMQTDAYYKMNFYMAYSGAAINKNTVEAIKALDQNIKSLAHDVFYGERDLLNFAKGIIDRNLILSPEQNAHRKV